MTLATTDAVMVLDFSPPPYLSRLVDWLKREEKELWNWFASQPVRAEHSRAALLELLKTTYRLDETAAPDIHILAADVAEKLGVDVPIQLYQGSADASCNAGLAFIPGEIHLTFQGPVLKRLDEAETTALLGHELTHFLLWQAEGGDYLIADRLLAALSLDAAGGDAYVASSRLFRLYAEIFCDRGALQVNNDPAVVIRMLVKLQSGLEQVNADSFLRQADEVLAAGAVRAEGLSHPETYIRARALRLWSESPDDLETQIASMLEGPPVLDELDLLQRREVCRQTRWLIDALLRESWLRTDSTLAHARLYFEDYEWTETTQNDTAHEQAFRNGDTQLQDYFCFVLLDFVTADSDLESYPLAAALCLAERIGLHGRFATLAQRELRLRKNQLAAVDLGRESMLREARETSGAERAS